MIETDNYYRQQREGRIAANEECVPESVRVAEQLGALAGTESRIALPVAGADGPAERPAGFRAA
ncbi:hypothetical protein I4I73_25195 [Pseudonocardia sp. KRD-184]|uniref:Uncharacterized protein n=1 Tax=Pseudonocardia oceani TaxID=2792013 RepID=A0ABS6UBP6_9PSEU|nr:hypothetical protein [Pseudonocardia oceani]MBW0092563.1 hypothetical protein [Pseudonocardia oceani]MBW0099295.1 hypothetical protein [Pseudonocardia oceani]MBW0111805.1 hypothetical protein [Pseudonocardia oceani]MBW0125416.1 hypothetical protein [Pseudonocardia oceani]MBW0129669.1 hypothetical protein [Pseudonocardia oceani]